LKILHLQLVVLVAVSGVHLKLIIKMCSAADVLSASCYCIPCILDLR
jgi:hypothetical protein